MEKETRQEMLVNLLLTDKNHWWTQKEIASRISGYHLRETTSSNDLCPTMTNDRIKINANLDVCCIIVVMNYRFKIASKEEAKREIASHIRRIKAQREQIINMARKIELNGQVIMDLDVKDVMSEDFLKEFECFETQE